MIFSIQKWSKIYVLIAEQMWHPEHREVHIQLLMMLILCLRYMFRQILVVQSLYHQGSWSPNQISIYEGCGVSQVRYDAKSSLQSLNQSYLSKKKRMSGQCRVYDTFNYSANPELLLIIQSHVHVIKQNTKYL